VRDRTQHAEAAWPVTAATTSRQCEKAKIGYSTWSISVTGVFIGTPRDSAAASALPPASPPNLTAPPNPVNVYVD
jgi:hypothetical protein